MDPFGGAEWRCGFESPRLTTFESVGEKSSTRGVADVRYGRGAVVDRGVRLMRARLECMKGAARDPRVRPMKTNIASSRTN